MLGHAGGDVSKVMLDREQRQTRCLCGSGRSVVRMQVTHGKNRMLGMQLNQILGCPCMGRARLNRSEIADVLAQNRTVRVRQRERALEMAAEGENAGAHTPERYRRRRVTPCPPQQ